jgi:hypothetical protein
MTTTISKSKYLNGLQCPKLLWHHFNDRNAFPPISPAKQAIFDTGHYVGDLAKELYPDGIEVPWSWDLAKTCSDTIDLLEKRKPIFEASFLIDGCYCRVDVLVPVDGDSWDLNEVKSSTSVKDVNIADVAFQARLAELSGVKLDRLFLMHIDKSYVRDGEIESNGLFHAEDVTTRARDHQPGVSAQVKKMRNVITDSCPDIGIGNHCSSPYECDLWEACSAFLPKDSVLEIYWFKKKAFRFIDRGITSIVDVPTAELGTKQQIQQRAVSTGQPHIEPEPIRKWLCGLEYPLYCFDFETMMPAVPLIDGTKPYRQIPFQFSLHIVKNEGAEAEHVEFLAESPSDPRPSLIEALRAIGPTGTILAYNMSFEQMILRQLADDFPEHKAFLMGLEGRFQDLIIPFREFWYYSPDQKGSCSLKYVLPAMTGISYEGMEIADGSQAMHEFKRVVFEKVEQKEKARVLEGLRVYCKQDTQALLDILNGLRAMV